MAESVQFTGFSKDTVRFFKGLANNNNRVWFESHRELYESAVMAPSRAFIEAMGARLRTIVPGIVAVPKVNKSIFRLNRDTRFSLDPSPYKTNLGLLFWEGTRARMECPGFYFHLEPPDLMIGGGYYFFADRAIERFRKAVVDRRLGRELATSLAPFADKEGWEIGGEHYKRVPQGYDPAHPNARFLRHNGLYAGWEGKIPPEFYSPRLLDFCLERYALLVPLHRWLVKTLA
jgi:uncharacterized protein (TIGR02453 family)